MKFLLVLVAFAMLFSFENSWAASRYKKYDPKEKFTYSTTNRCRVKEMKWPYVMCQSPDPCNQTTPVNFCENVYAKYKVKAVSKSEEDDHAYCQEGKTTVLCQNDNCSKYQAVALCETLTKGDSTAKK